MYLSLFILFATILCSGLCVYFIPRLPEWVYQLLVVFGGSYLFSFMLVHMLPELFAEHESSVRAIGIYLLVGFFLQIFLDFFSQGVAHGHEHIRVGGRAGGLSLFKGGSVLVGLCLHALLEGVLLGVAPKHSLCCHHRTSLMMGILLHKVPIALTLGVILHRAMARRVTVVAFLTLFALASPIGWLGSHYLQVYEVLSSEMFLAIQAVAMGGLLHIATTILFEANPHHHFNFTQLMVVVAGGVMALVI